MRYVSTAIIAEQGTFSPFSNHGFFSELPSTLTRHRTLSLVANTLVQYRASHSIHVVP